MAMMGSSPGGGGEMSFNDVIGLLKSEPAYQTKMSELGKAMEQSTAMHQQAVEISRQTEEAKRLTAGMAAQAEKQLLEAKQLKEEADKLTAAALAHEKDLNRRQEDWQIQANAELSRQQEVLRDTFATREKEYLAKEQALLAKVKEFKDMQAEHKAATADFAALSKAKEAEFARKEASLSELDGKLIASYEEVQASKQDLKAKLDAIKAITAK